MKSEKGFTLLELMVSLSILSVMMAMLVGYVLSMQNHFFNDIVRTRINSNLRSAFDIVGMNIRQTGENLKKSFPAVVLTNDIDGAGKYLQLRRNLIPEVLTVCTTLNAGASSVNVSKSNPSNSACLYSNVTSVYNAFNTERLSKSGSIRMYIFNSLTKSGEFVDYTSGSTSPNYSLIISGTSATYPADSTYLYLLEEYAFGLDETENTLNLFRDGKVDKPEAVAFSISAFDVVIKHANGGELNLLAPSSADTWKQIKNISIGLTGTESWKTRDFSTTLNGEFFPRNIISK